MPRKRTTSEVICQFQKVHGNKFDYSKFAYITQELPSIITCRIHGDFYQNANNHIHKKQGCPSCSRNRKGNTQTFIEEASKIHGNKYDYSKVIYKNNKTPVTIICPLHGEIRQIPYNHIVHKNGCAKCAGVGQSNTTEFIQKAKKIHGDRYKYESVNYMGVNSPITIYCYKCKKVFSQKPSDHLEGKGCSRCKQSKGEHKIEKILSDIGVVFSKQQTFPDCRNPLTGYKLRFDFYLPHENLLIEFDGPQHHRCGRVGSYFFSKNEVARIQFRDKIKNDFACSKNIRLLRIQEGEDIECKIKKTI